MTRLDPCVAIPFVDGLSPLNFAVRRHDLRPGLCRADPSSSGRPGLPIRMPLRLNPSCRSALVNVALRVLRAVLPWVQSAIVFPVAAAAPDSLVADLETRLATNGVENVNAYLVDHWSSAMVPLNQKTTTCDLRAVRLAVRLGRGRDARATQAHRESLRAAVGSCTVFVLALATREEVPVYCSSVSSWTVMQTVRELRRRIAAIESDELLAASLNGKSCRAAYLYELENTRVGLKTVPRQSSRQSR